MSDKIKVLVVEPEKPSQVQEVPDELKALQALVGGNIDAVYPFDESVAVVFDREGKIKALPFNRPLLDDLGEPYDILCGTFFITGVSGENFVSLTDDQIRRYKELYDNVMVVPDKGNPDVGRITHARPLGTKKPSVKNKAEHER